MKGTIMGEEVTVDASKVKPINNFVFVRKCKRGDEGLIVTTEQYKEHSEFVEILAVGGKCKIFDKSHIGKTVQCPEAGDGMHCVDDHGEFWMVRETLLTPAVVG